MKDSTTLKKIAETLGISISTVSRALKNHPDISIKTRQKVNELATALDYEPNNYAIQLRTNKSRIFGLICPSISFFFYDSFISSVEEECRKCGYSLLILQSGDDTAVELENLKICRQNRVSGVFVCLSPNTIDFSPFTRLTKQDIPVIFFDKVPDLEDTNRVSLSDKVAARQAVDILMDSKKKQVLAILGNENLSITRRRKQAMKERIEEKTRGMKIDFMHAGSSKEANEIFHESLGKRKKFDTVFCMSDEILTGVMKAIQQIGLRIPDQISVFCMSNGFFPKLFMPEIDYIETSGFKLGKLAFTQMMASISGNKINQELSIDCEYVKGGSL
jgi:LacI family transcriptional regulator